MASIPQDKCPVDHSAVASSSQTDKCPVDHDASSPSSSASADTCPVEHGARSSWTNIFGSQGPAHPHVPSGLPTDREVSSIPRADGTNWVYPSEAQFFAAMARKNHSPQANDMKVIVPIHNAVNERAWAEVMKWESGQGGEKCGGIKLVSFKGRPGDRSPKARWKTLLGYTAPFDRHDWIIERCGVRMRYVIDFYTGRSRGPSSGPSFYLDARPALDNWEGVRMRASNFWDTWVGSLWGSPTAPPSKQGSS